MKGWNEARRVCLGSMKRGRNKKGVFKNKDKVSCQQNIYIISPSHNSIKFMHKCLKYVDGLPHKSNPP